MKKYLILLFVALAAVFQSCNNNDDLWDAIDELKSRVTALETQVDALNSNIVALQTLYSGATISSVEETDGTYVLTLTNGDVITLVQGSEAEAVIPVVSIDENGYWQVSYDGGETFTSLEVKAEGEDGVTPLFQIEESTGYWQVSYDGGESYTYVLDTSGNKVSAVGSATITDKFFEEVRVDGEYLYIKLLDGTELYIPILADFFCKIVTTTEGVQTFDSGVTKRFEVQMRGVEAALVTCPEGWTARLTDPVDEVAELVVTAPDTDASTTRATANSSQDVAILATSGKYSCIAKIQVECTGAEAVAPTISIANSTSVEPTESTLTFDVTLSSNADGWKYICLKTDEIGTEEPDADTIFADGTTVSGSSTTVEGLDAETSYTIFAVAYAGDLISEVATATNTTTAEPADPNDYYVSGVEINGQTYDQNSEGARLLEVASTAETDVTVNAPSTTTVSFIGHDNSDTYGFVMAATSSIGITADNIYIGRYADDRPQITFSRYLALRNSDGIVAFKNLVLNFENVSDTYLFNFSGAGGVGTLIFEDCEIIFASQSFITGYNGAGSIGNVIFRNCKIRYTGTASAYIFNLSNPGSMDLTTMATVVVENNIIYSTAASNMNCTFMTANGLDLSSMALTVEQNTFVDYRGSGTSVNISALFVLSQFGSISCKNNIFYSSQDSGYPAVFSLMNDYGSSWPTIDMERTSNIAYGCTAWKMFSEITSAYYPSTYGTTITIPLASSDPLTTCDTANGVFVVSSDYAGYGSTLE